jgi:hypothetical protein
MIHKELHCEYFVNFFSDVHFIETLFHQQLSREILYKVIGLIHRKSIMSAVGEASRVLMSEDMGLT